MHGNRATITALATLSALAALATLPPIASRRRSLIIPKKQHFHIESIAAIPAIRALLARLSFATKATHSRNGQLLVWPTKIGFLAADRDIASSSTLSPPSPGSPFISFECSGPDHPG